jgi:hypothetical protein
MDSFLAWNLIKEAHPIQEEGIKKEQECFMGTTRQ